MGQETYPPRVRRYTPRHATLSEIEEDLWQKFIDHPQDPFILNYDESQLKSRLTQTEISQLHSLVTEHNLELRATKDRFKLLGIVQLTQPPKTETTR